MALALSAFWGSACSSGSSPGVTAPTATVRFEAGERASAKAVEGFVSAVAGAYGRAVASQVVRPSRTGSGIPGADRLDAAATAPASCDSVALRYFNAQGQQQPAYDPATTTRVGAKGPCSTP